MSTDSSIPVRALYDVPEAMALLNLSRTQIYADQDSAACDCDAGSSAAGAG